MANVKYRFGVFVHHILEIFSIKVLATKQLTSIILWTIMRLGHTLGPGSSFINYVPYTQCASPSKSLPFRVFSGTIKGWNHSKGLVKKLWKVWTYHHGSDSAFLSPAFYYRYQWLLSGSPNNSCDTNSKIFWQWHCPNSCWLCLGWSRAYRTHCLCHWATKESQWIWKGLE